MLRSLVTISIFVVLAAPQFAQAGDEVDYSAPYLVVENGELVTKYPALEHAAASPADSPQASSESGAPSGAPQQQDGSGKNWTGVAAAITVAVVLVLLVRRKRQQ